MLGPMSHAWWMASSVFDGHLIEELTLMLDDLYSADEVFLTGNYSKIQPVVQVAKTEYQIGPVATRARELYFDFAKRMCGKTS